MYTTVSLQAQAARFRELAKNSDATSEATLLRLAADYEAEALEAEICGRATRHKKAD